MKHSEIERLLPSVIQRAQPPGSPLAAVLDVMETLHEPVERTLAGLVACFNPRSCDTRFIMMLAHWVNLDRLYASDEVSDQGPDWTPRPAPIALGRLRELIAAAPKLAGLRGTTGGLKSFVEIATGLKVAIDEAVTTEDGKRTPFHVRIVAPMEGQAHRELITRIVELEKPAYVTYELVFRDSADS
jgi:phage tail-like protein